MIRSLDSAFVMLLIQLLLVKKYVFIMDHVLIQSCCYIQDLYMLVTVVIT